MKLPEPLFAIINPVMRFLLRSPLHWLMSSSLMLITYTGRKSGKVYTTPVRYLRTNSSIQCFTSADTKWWRNLRGGAEVTLTIQGEDKHFLAKVIENDLEKTREALRHYLTVFPQDAAYHDVKLRSDKSLVIADLDRAAKHAIVVVATPLNAASQNR
jgi:deazaflavin-dependent oxidoreductase (nitroreductase family)